MGWFNDSSIKIVMDKDLQGIIDSVIKNAGAKNEADAIRYAALHAIFPWDNKENPTKNADSPKKRESTDKRTARLTAVLEQLISTNKQTKQPILMRVTADERTALRTSEIPVKHWQLAITERILRDETGVNQSVASRFIEQNKAAINQHNAWLFDNCGWSPKDAHAFNRRTKAAARKYAQLELN